MAFQAGTYQVKSGWNPVQLQTYVFSPDGTFSYSADYLETEAGDGHAIRRKGLWKVSEAKLSVEFTETSHPMADFQPDESNMEGEPMSGSNSWPLTAEGHPDSSDFLGPRYQGDTHPASFTFAKA